MYKKFYFWAAILGIFAVLFGAFGTHLLKAKLSAENMAVYQTGVQYHFYHVFALIIATQFYRKYNHSLLSTSAYCFLFGLLIFPFSLYGLALSSLSTAGPEKWLGYFTPFGGSLFAMGWLFIAIYFSTNRNSRNRKSKETDL